MTQKPFAIASLQAELDATLQQLGDDTLGIDEAMAAYEKGLDIIKQLQKHLKTAENTLEKLQVSLDA